MIPLFSPVRQNEPFLPEWEKKFTEFVRGGEYILGKITTQFETNLARATGYQHAVGCSSGTDALILALHALGAEPGDEIVTPAFSFVASSNAIVWAGAKPVFADVDLETGNVTAESIEKVLTSKTRGVMAVDLFGRQAPIQEIRKLCDRYKLYLIEDGAQSIGVPKKSAHAYTTSFYPTKNLGAMGDAGAVLTDDRDLADRVKELSRHGGLVRDNYVRKGTNGRLDSFHAMILDSKLPKLSQWTKMRSSMAGFYLDKLAKVENNLKCYLPRRAPASGEHVWALFTIRVPERRNETMEWLKNNGVGCAVYYPKAIPDQPSMKPYAKTPCPNAQRLANEVLSIPIYPELTGKELEVVVDKLSQCLSR